MLAGTMPASFPVSFCLPMSMDGSRLYTNNERKFYPTISDFVQPEPPAVFFHKEDICNVGFLCGEKGAYALYIQAAARKS